MQIIISYFLCIQSQVALPTLDKMCYITFYVLHYERLSSIKYKSSEKYLKTQWLDDDILNHLITKNNPYELIFLGCYYSDNIKTSQKIRKKEDKYVINHKYKAHQFTWFDEDPLIYTAAESSNILLRFKKQVYQGFLFLKR